MLRRTTTSSSSRRFSSAPPPLSPSSYATSRSGQTYLFLLQNKWPQPQRTEQQQQQQQNLPLLADGREKDEHDALIQKLLFDDEQQNEHNRQQPLRGGGDPLSRELASILASTSSSTGKSIGWSKALSLLSSALTARRNVLASSSSSFHSVSPIVSSSTTTTRVNTLHFNLALAISHRCHHWAAMQRCEASMAVNGIPADAHTLNIFMDASCASGDWANALELFTSAVSFSDRAAREGNQQSEKQQQQQQQEQQQQQFTLSDAGPLFNAHSVKLALQAVSTPTPQQSSGSSSSSSKSSRVDGSRWNAALRIYGRFPRTIEQSDDDPSLLGVVVRAASSRADSDKPLLRTWQERWQRGAMMGSGAVAAAATRRSSSSSSLVPALDAESFVHLGAAAERSETWTVSLELASGAIALGPVAASAASSNVVSKLMSSALRTACRTRKADATALELLRSFLRQRQQLQQEVEHERLMREAVGDDDDDEATATAAAAASLSVFTLEPSAVDAASTICARLGKFQDLARVKQFALDSLGFGSSTVYTALLRLLENRFEYMVRKKVENEEQQKTSTSSIFDPDVAVSQQRSVLHEFLSQCRDGKAINSIASDSVAWLCLDTFKGMLEQQQKKQSEDEGERNQFTGGRNSSDTLWSSALARLSVATRQPDAMVFAVALEIVRSSSAAPSSVAAMQVLEAALAAVQEETQRNSKKKNNNNRSGVASRRCKPFAVTVHDALEIFTDSSSSSSRISSNSEELGRATQIAIELGFNGTKQLQRAITLLQLGWFKNQPAVAAAAVVRGAKSTQLIPLLVRVDQKSTAAAASPAEQEKLITDIVQFAATTTTRESSSSSSSKLLLSFFMRRLFSDWGVESRQAALLKLLLLVTADQQQRGGIAAEFVESDLDWLHESLSSLVGGQRTALQQEQRESELGRIFAAARLVAAWGQNAAPLYRLPDSVVASLLTATVSLQQQSTSSSSSSSLWQQAMSLFASGGSLLASSKLLQKEDSSSLLFLLIKSCLMAGDVETATQLLCDKRRPQRLDATEVSAFLLSFISENSSASPSSSSSTSLVVARAADFYGAQWPRRVRVKLLQSQWGSVQLMGQEQQQQQRREMVKRMQVDVSGGGGGAKQQQQQQQQQQHSELVTTTGASAAAAISELFVSHLCAAPETITVNSLVCVVRSIVDEGHDDSSQQLQRVLSSVQAADVNGKLTGRAALAIAAEWRAVSKRQRKLTVPVVLEQLLRQALAEGLRVSDSVWRGAAAVAVVRAAHGVVVIAGEEEQQQFDQSLSLFLRLSAPAAMQPDTFFPLLIDTLSAVSALVGEQKSSDVAMTALALVTSRSGNNQHLAAVKEEQQQHDFRHDFLAEMMGIGAGFGNLSSPSQTGACHSSSNNTNPVVCCELRAAALQLIVTALDDVLVGEKNKKKKSNSIDLKSLFNEYSVSPAVIASACERIVQQRATGDGLDDNCKQCVADLLYLFRSSSSSSSDGASSLLPFRLFSLSSSPSSSSSTCAEFLSDSKLVASLADSMRARSGISVVVLRGVVESTLRCMMTPGATTTIAVEGGSRDMVQSRLRLFAACASFVFEREEEETALRRLVESVPFAPLFAGCADDKMTQLLLLSVTTLLEQHAPQQLLRSAWRRAVNLKQQQQVLPSSLFEQLLFQQLCKNSNGSPALSALSARVGCQLLVDALLQLHAADVISSSSSSSLAETTNLHLSLLLDLVADQDSNSNNNKKEFRSLLSSTVHEHCTMIARTLRPEVATRAFDSLLKSVLFSLTTATRPSSSSASYSALLVAHAVLRQRKQPTSSSSGIHQRALEQLLPPALLRRSEEQQRQQRSVVVVLKKQAAGESKSNGNQQQQQQQQQLLLAELVAWRIECKDASLSSSSSSSLLASSLPSSALCAAIDQSDGSPSSSSHWQSVVVDEILHRGEELKSQSATTRTDLLAAALRAASNASFSSSSGGGRLFTLASQQLSLALTETNISSSSSSMGKNKQLFISAFAHALDLVSSSSQQQQQHLFLDPTPAQQAKIKRHHRNNTTQRVPVLVTTPALRAAVRCASSLGCVKELAALCRYLREVASSSSSSSSVNSSSSNGSSSAADICARLERGILLFHLPLACAAWLGNEERRQQKLTSSSRNPGQHRRRRDQEAQQRREEELLTLCMKEQLFGGAFLKQQQLLPLVSSFRAAIADSQHHHHHHHLQHFDDPLARKLLSLSYGAESSAMMWFCLEGTQPKPKTLLRQQQQQPKRAVEAPPPPSPPKTFPAPTKQQQQQQQQHLPLPKSHQQQILPSLWRDALHEVQQLTSSRKRATRADWGAAVERLGGPQRVDFLFAMRTPWQLASKALADVCRNSSNSSNTFFLCTVARAHLRNVSKSVQPQEVTTQVKSQQALALATALFLSSSSAEQHREHQQQDPKLLTELMRPLSWNSSRSGAATWEVCFKLYSIEQKSSDKNNNSSNNSVDSLMSLVYAVQNAPLSSMAEEVKQRRMNQIAAEFGSRERKKNGLPLFSGQDRKRLANVLAASKLVDVRLLEDILNH